MGTDWAEGGKLRWLDGGGRGRLVEGLRNHRTVTAF